MSNNIIPLSKETAEITLNALRQWDNSEQKDTPLAVAIGEIERLLENPINLDDWAVVPKKYKDRDIFAVSYQFKKQGNMMLGNYMVGIDGMKSHPALEGGDDA